MVMDRPSLHRTSIEHGSFFKLTSKINKKGTSCARSYYYEIYAAMQMMVMESVQVHGWTLQSPCQQMARR